MEDAAAPRYLPLHLPTHHAVEGLLDWSAGSACRLKFASEALVGRTVWGSDATRCCLPSGMPPWDYERNRYIQWSTATIDDRNFVCLPRRTPGFGSSKTRSAESWGSRRLQGLMVRRDDPPDHAAMGRLFDAWDLLRPRSRDPAALLPYLTFAPAVCRLAGLARLHINGFIHFWAATARSLRALHHPYLHFCATRS